MVVLAAEEEDGDLDSADLSKDALRRLRVSQRSERLRYTKKDAAHKTCAPRG